MKNTLRRASTLTVLATFLSAAGASPIRASEGPSSSNTIAASVERLTSIPPAASAFVDSQSPTPASTPPSKRKRSALRTIGGAVLGGTVGLVAGAYIGARIPGECDCDDSSIAGAIFGGAVGLLGGAIAGGVLLGK